MAVDTKRASHLDDLQADVSIVDEDDHAFLDLLQQLRVFDADLSLGGSLPSGERLIPRRIVAANLHDLVLLKLDAFDRVHGRRVVDQVARLELRASGVHKDRANLVLFRRNLGSQTNRGRAQ